MANSPSLCPTIDSLTNTGTCFFPSCTAMVCPTISGTTVDRRDHVLMTRLSPRRFISSTLAIRWSSTNGPFFTERGMAGSAPSLPAAAHDELVRRLWLAGPAFLLPPWAGGVAPAAGLPLAAAQRMVDGVHGHPSDGGTDAQPARTAGLPQGYELTLGVPHLAHGGPAPGVHHADLP